MGARVLGSGANGEGPRGLGPCFCGQAESLGAPGPGARQRRADGARELTCMSGQRLAMNRTLRARGRVWNGTDGGKSKLV